MKTLQYLALCITLCFSHHSFAQENTAAQDQEIVYDLFPGTLIEKNQQLYLHSCQTMDVEFKLKFNHASDEQRIRKLMQKYNKFWLYLTAAAETEGDDYRLTVESIAEEYPNKTCHLTELLEDYSQQKSAD